MPERVALQAPGVAPKAAGLLATLPPKRNRGVIVIAVHWNRDTHAATQVLWR